jgi:hypothetical protein
MALDPDRLQIQTFAGIQNTAAPRDIGVNALQDAVNVDLTNNGGVAARPGYALAEALSIDSAYTTADGTTYVVSGGYLHRVAEDLSRHQLCPASASTVFADYQKVLFTSNGYQILGDTVTDLRTSVPAQPAVVITGGIRPAGQYNIVATSINASGLESGSSRVLTVTLDSPGDILVTPWPGDSACNIYITDTNGASYHDQATGYRLGAAFINANPIPDSPDCIEYHESSLYVAKVFGEYTALFYSVPLHPHLFSYDDSYIAVPGRVIAMKSTTQGLVIGTDAAIYVYAEEQLTQLASYGVTAGRPMVKLPDGTLYIHTQRGVCKALPFEELTADVVSLPMGAICTAAYLETNGIKRYVGLHDGAGTAFNPYSGVH